MLTAVPFARGDARGACVSQAGITACDIAAAEGHSELSDMLYAAASQHRPKHGTFTMDV